MYPPMRAHWLLLANTIDRVSFGPPQSTTQMANWSVQLFVRSWWQKVPILYSGRLFPKHCPFPWVSGPQLIHDSVANLTPQPKQHLDWFSHFCTDDCRVSLYFTMVRPFPPQNCLFPWRDMDSNLIYGSVGPPESSTQMASQSFQLFCRTH